MPPEGGIHHVPAFCRHDQTGAGFSYPKKAGSQKKDFFTDTILSSILWNDPFYIPDSF